jgi:hypothetical protein
MILIRLGCVINASVVREKKMKSATSTKARLSVCPEFESRRLNEPFLELALFVDGDASMNKLSGG